LLEQVLDHFSLTSKVQSWNVFWTRLGPCVAFALLLVFTSYEPHFTSATVKNIIDVTAEVV